MVFIDLAVEVFTWVLKENREKVTNQGIDEAMPSKFGQERVALSQKPTKQRIYFVCLVAFGEGPVPGPL